MVEPFQDKPERGANAEQFLAETAGLFEPQAGNRQGNVGQGNEQQRHDDAMEIKIDKAAATAIIETCDALLAKDPKPDRVGLPACVEYIKAKIIEAEKAVKFRDDSYKTWRGGTDASWRAAGCFDSKAERLKTSDLHGRIAIKCRKELQLLQAVLEQLTASAAKTCRWIVNDYGAYDTQCDNAFQFTHDGIKANSFRFCPFCGGEISQPDTKAAKETKI